VLVDDEIKRGIRGKDDNGESKLLGFFSGMTRMRTPTDEFPSSHRGNLGFAWTRKSQNEVKISLCVEIMRKWSE